MNHIETELWYHNLAERLDKEFPDAEKIDKPTLAWMLEQGVGTFMYPSESSKFLPGIFSCLLRQLMEGDVPENFGEKLYGLLFQVCTAWGMPEPVRSFREALDSYQTYEQCSLIVIVFVTLAPLVDIQFNPVDMAKSVSAWLDRAHSLAKESNRHTS